MQDNIVDVRLEEFNYLNEQFAKGINKFNSNNTYVIRLENCDGITTDMLETFKELPIDIKFKIQRDLYGIKSLEQSVQFNYSLDEMEKIISVFEEIGKEMPEGLTEIGRFLYIYRILCETIEYKDIIPANIKDLIEVNGLQRSLYSALLTGDGVCAGYALTLKNVLNYYGINCIQVDGEAFLPDGRSRRAFVECS